jgi:hypothetical protein
MPVQELDDLYGLALDEFTAARNTLARSLTQGGDREKAAEVKAARKPGLIAWAINQVARTSPERIEQLFTAADELADAQARAVTGDPSGLRPAMAEMRRQIETLAQEASQRLQAAGHAAGMTQQSQIRNTLWAAATDAAYRPTLRAGRLTETLDPGGFGLVPAGDAEPAEPVAPREAKPEKKPPRRQPRPAEPDQATQRAAAAAAAKRAEQLEGQARRARQEAAEARQGAAAARSEADLAQRRAQKAQEKADRADQAAREAEAAARAARQEAKVTRR